MILLKDLVLLIHLNLSRLQNKEEVSILSCFLVSCFHSKTNSQIQCFFLSKETFFALVICNEIIAQRLNLSRLAIA